MYCYATVCFLDVRTEQFIKNLWKYLSDNNISNYGYEMKGRRPHITISDYNILDKGKFMSSLEKFYDDREKVDIEFNTLGTFVNSGTLFISPTISKDLLQFHNNYHKHFNSFNDNPNSFYLPGKWNPHCTVASRLNEDNMTKAFKYCSKELKKINGKLIEIALLEIEVNIEGTAVDSNVIFSKNLK